MARKLVEDLLAQRQHPSRWYEKIPDAKEADALWFVEWVAPYLLLGLANYMEQVYLHESEVGEDGSEIYMKKVADEWWRIHSQIFYILSIKFVFTHDQFVREQHLKPLVKRLNDEAGFDLTRDIMQYVTGLHDVLVEVGVPVLMPERVIEVVQLWTRRLLDPEYWTRKDHTLFFELPENDEFDMALLPTKVIIDNWVLEKLFGRILIARPSNAAEIREFYDSLAPSYHEVIDLPFKKRTLCQLMVKLPKRKGRVLDVGAGDSLAKKLYPRTKLIGVDLSLEMLKQGKQTGEILIQANADCLPFPADFFDNALMSFMAHYVSDWPQLLSEIKRTLKSGGCFAFSIRRPSGNWQEEYRSLLSMSGFKQLTFWEEWETLQSGESVKVGYVRGRTPIKRQKTNKKRKNS